MNVFSEDANKEVMTATTYNRLQLGSTVKCALQLNCIRVCVTAALRRHSLRLRLLP